MQTFEIPEAPLTVSLTRGGNGTPDVQAPHAGSLRFTVNNKAGYGVSGRASVLPQGDANAAWFAVEGEAQRQFPASGSHVYTVRIQVPHDTPPGRHAFRLRVVNVNDPDNDFAESSVAGFEVPAAAGPGGFRWWILLVALAGLLLVAAAAFAVWKFLPDDEVEVADLVGEATMCEEVRERYPELDVVCVPAEAGTGLPAGTVLAQDPAFGEALPAKSTLTLTYDPGVVMPALVTVRVADATARLQAMGLEPVLNDLGPAALDGRALDTVLAQRPPAGEPLDPEGTVELDYVKGVRVARFIDMQLADALLQANALGLDLATPTASNTTNQALDGKVRAQTPGENEIVSTGTPVLLTYYKHRTSSPCRTTRQNGRLIITGCLATPVLMEARTNWRLLQPDR